MRPLRLLLPFVACCFASAFSACDKPAPPVAPPHTPAAPPKDPPADASTVWTPRPAPIEGDIIVAVVDTGVDAEHPALKGKLLEGVNLAPAPGDTKDDIGHGTAIAGLICADSEQDSFDGVCSKLPVKILPIKVTTPRDSTALPTVVGLAVQEAVKRGAHVICIPMGGSFTSDALETGMAQAKEKGVLVLAAAGIGSPATHDFYPAAHPWAISCTGEREAAMEKFGGKEMQWYYRAELANHSGKTELMGPIFAKVLAPGGGFATLQGTSVACGQAAGLAARLIAANRTWSAQRVRDVLTLSGSPDYAGNAFLECPARHIDAELIAAQGADGGARPADLALVWTEPNPDPKPGIAFAVSATIRNLGGSPGSGTLTCRLTTQADGRRVDISELKPGETRLVNVSMEGLEPGNHDYEVVLVQKDGVNLANDRLKSTIVSDPRDGTALCYLNRLEGMRADSGKVLLRSLVKNPNQKPLEVKLIVAISEPDAEISIHLAPGEARDVELPLVLAKPTDAKKGVVVTLEIETGGKLHGDENILFDMSRTSFSPQYADVWGLKEVIVDAPASVGSARSTIPFMIFTPEVHTAQIPEDYKYKSRKTGLLYPASGLWISDVMIDLLEPEQAASYRPSGRFDVDVPIGRGLFVAHHPLGAEKLIGPRTFWSDGGGYRVEDWLGMAFQKNKFLGWKYHDGWHAIIVVPRQDVEYFKDKDYSGVRPQFFRIGVRYFDLKAHPAAVDAADVDWDKRRRPKPPAELWQESVLRVVFNVDLPRLEPEGHYYDVHVHTAAEFSRDIVEPRLAFGGPPWMIARCAHAMGMIDDRQLLTTMLRVHPKGLEFAENHGVDLNQDVVITTDHNCFLTDRDEPSDAPFGGRFGGYEFGMLREYFGRGANQELSMAKPNAPTGAMHALVYGAEPMEGPWHGGRALASTLAAVRDALEAVTLTDKALRYLRNIPGLKGLRPPLKEVAAALHTLKYGFGETQALRDGTRDGLQEVFQSELEKVTGKKVDIALIRKFCDVWGDVTADDLRRLLDEVGEALDAASERQEKNPWSVYETENTLLPRDKSYVAAHPFLGTKSYDHVEDLTRGGVTLDGESRANPTINENKPRAPGDLSWQEGELQRAANMTWGYKGATRYPRRFPFRGAQFWNEPHFYSAMLDSPSDLTRLNIWRTGVLQPEWKWNDEFAFGMHYYFKSMVQPGLRWSFEPDLPREDGARRFFMRKTFHLAGSDAHGSFNYTTGVGATMLTDTKFGAVFALLGTGHGTETHTSHYGAARVYAQKPSVDEFLEGRVVCTDGPLVWPELDTDVRFDSLTSIWHDSWTLANKGNNADGEIGGRGPFDGGRTALARRGSADMVLRWRSAGDRGVRGPVKRVEAYRVAVSQELVPRATRGMQVPFLAPAATFTSAPDHGFQYALLGSTVAAEEPQALMIGGYTADSDAGLFDIEQRRCIANPIWISTVEIGLRAKPVVENGRAFIPKGAFVARFRTDHSVLDFSPDAPGGAVQPIVWAKKFNAKGDSVAGTWRLIPVWRGDDVGYWDNEERQVDGKIVRVADCVMTAMNEEEIPLGPEWYPVEGVNTFAGIWGNPRDAFGNSLNSVANILQVGVPPGTVVTPDPPSDWGGGNPDPEKTTPTGNTMPGPWHRPVDTAEVCVKPGDQLQLPKGATCDGNKIPPGPWTVPDLPEKGLSLIVTSGGQTLTMLLTASATNSGPTLERTNPGFYGVVPTAGKGPARVTLKNHTQKTLEIADPVLVTGDTCVFSAPQAEPGACDVTVTQGEASKTTPLEAVAAKISWDQADAKPGDVRTLRITLEGAKAPGDWTVSGTIELTNGQILSVTDPARITMKGPALTVEALPGSVRDVAQVQALQTGQMTAKARLRAVRVEGK